jgi:Zn finger protein HypA/HybF involved in hydrogenase expression
MAEASTISVAVLAFFSLVVAMLFWFRRLRRRKPDMPIIELERLVKCKSCGSQIPESARKCAFCGAWQFRIDSGEQIKAPERNGKNAADGSH